MKFIEKENPVNLFGFSFLIVTTGSMEPEIKAGELIIIKEVKEYKKNDIVTFVDQDEFLVTHRIIELNEEKMITKGDNNDLEDEETQLEFIKGKVVFHSRVLGYFILYLLKPLIFVYVIFILTFNIIIVFFAKERKEIEDEDKNFEK